LLNLGNKLDSFTHPGEGISRIESEKQVVEKMILIYCRSHHGGPGLCDDCRSLLHYSHERLDSCPFKERKDFCSKCIVHCYTPAERERIRKVMGYSGPRILRYYPVVALKHMLGK
jgi:predicted amidophosphoribosyltransferase